MVVALFFAIAGCHSTITRPDVPDDPVTVFFLVDGQHHGLILPDGEGQFTEYGYGEWWWFANNMDSWYRAFPTVLWPTQGALGRRPIAVADERALRDRFHWMDITAFDAERPRVEALRDRLAARYESRRDEEIFNSRYRFWFVPDDDSYWAWWNCTDAMAAWLEELGCEVSWVPIRIGLEFEALE